MYRKLPLVLIIFFLQASLVAKAGYHCSLTVADLHKLRTSLLCSCDDDTVQCAILVDAFQRPSKSTLSAVVGAAIGTHINYRKYAPYVPSGRISRAGLNDWASITLKNCPLITSHEIRTLLTKEINQQLKELNSNQKLCKAVENVYDDFQNPHFVGRCEGKNLIATPRHSENAVEHTVIRQPASNDFTHILRSRGGETAKNTRRAFKTSIKGRQVLINYTLNFVDAENRPQQPTVEQKNHITTLWNRYRKEFVEMVNCCAYPGQKIKFCDKYKIKAY